MVTNESFLQELLKEATKNVLMQTFIVVALQNYSNRVKTDPQYQWSENSFIPFSSWDQCADFVLEKYNALFNDRYE